MGTDGIVNKVYKSNKVCCIVVSLFVVFSSLASIFAGKYSHDSNIEYSANYLADVAVNHTKSGKYCSLSVTPSDKKYKVINSNVEYYNSLNLFNNNQSPRFAGTVNANKDKKIKLTELSASTNYSFLYLENSSFTSYQVDNVWYQELYPLSLMDKGWHRLGDQFSFLYLSESQAKQILNKRGLEPTKENCISLIGTDIELTFDKKSYTWMIANIYYETGYYYDAVHEIMGEFFLGYNKYPDDFFKESTYLFNKETFQNKYFLKNLINNYSPDKYEYKYGKNNLQNGFTIDTRKLFMCFSDTNKTLSVITLIVSLLLFFLVFWLIIDTRFTAKIINALFIIGPILFMYLIFKYVCQLTGNFFLFTSFSSTLMLIEMVILLLSFIVVHISLRIAANKKEKLHE